MTQLDTFYTDTERYVSDHVADPHVREPSPGLGHLRPLLAPEPIAKEPGLFLQLYPAARLTSSVTPDQGHANQR